VAGDDRATRGMAIALELFKPGGPVGAPRFEYPKEIAEDWNRHSISTVMGDVWGPIMFLGVLALIFTGYPVAFALRDRASWACAAGIGAFLWLATRGAA